MAYSFDISQTPSGGLVIRREPGAVPRGLGLAFQWTGGLFLLALPLAVAQAGAMGGLSAIASAGIGIGVGRLLREVRREIQIDDGRRTVEAGWWMAERALPFDRIREQVDERGARVEGLRVEASSEDRTSWMWGVRLVPRARAEGRVLVYVDTPGEAERLGEQIAAQLAIEHVPWRPPSARAD